MTPLERRTQAEGSHSLMELIIVAGFVLGLAAVLAHLARAYPLDTRDLIDGSVVGGHASPAPLWPANG